VAGEDPRAAVEAAKRAARECARAARCSLDPESCLLAAKKLAERLGELPELASVRTVLAYGATPEEIDPTLAVERLRSCGGIIAYPRIESPGVLSLHVVVDDTELVRGPFGLAQPTEDAPRADPSDIDAVIVPGVAFDESGWRLGYGGGYYDRLLPLLRPDCARIGVAYDEQVLASIPAEEHDVRMHLVVTPTRVIRSRPE
jgi:5-formyltetrahydrofolate cyclo-ligase